MNGGKLDGQGSISGGYDDGEIEVTDDGSLSPSPREVLVEGLSDGVKDLSDGDETPVSEPFEASELKIIEDALQSLRAQSQRTNHEQGRGDGEVEESETGEQNADSVARLLKKVQAVRGLKNKRSSSGKKQGPPGGEDMNPTDIRQVVEVASQAALNAAKTAESVVSMLNRNSQAIEDLCKTLASPTSLQHSTHEAEEEVEVEEGEEEGEGAAGSSGTTLLDIELKQTEITKNIVRQNRITHWVLGFMVVSTLIWRYGWVKFVKQIKHSINNPFEGVQDVLDGWTGGADNQNDDKEDASPGMKFPSLMGKEDEAKLKSTIAGLKFPSILGKSSEDAKNKLRIKTDTEDAFLKFGRMLTGEKAETQEKSKKSSKEEN